MLGRLWEALASRQHAEEPREVGPPPPLERARSWRELARLFAHENARLRRGADPLDVGERPCPLQCGYVGPWGEAHRCGGVR